MEISYRDIEYRIDRFIIKDINIDFINNNIYGIIGKTGSGKTILLKILSGLIETKGKISLDKKEVNSKYLKKHIGYCFEHSFYMNTVEKELREVLIENNIQNELLIEKALNMVGLNKYYLNKNPLELSHSERILLSLAKVLILSKKILVLDDIVAGLDKTNKNNIIKILKTINKKYGVTIIIASNDISFINLITTNLIALDHGRVILQGKKQEILKKDTLLNKKGIAIPKILEFINKVEDKKKIKLGTYDDVKDLIKAVYRNV